MGGAAIPPGLLFGLGLLGADGWGQVFPKWPSLEEQVPGIFPRALPPMSFPHNEPQSCFPRRSSKNCSQVRPRAFALPWDPVHIKSVCFFQGWSLYFSQSHGAPVHKPHWPSMPDAPGALSPNARSPGMRA